MVEQVLDAMRSFIGIGENPPGSNNNSINTWYYGRPVSGSQYSWCRVTVAKSFNDAGLARLWLNGNVKETAYCPYAVGQAKKLGQWVTSGYKPGDVVFFDPDGNGQANHVGMIEIASPPGFTTIEGNTGDKCLRRQHTAKDFMGAFRPQYESEDDIMLEELVKRSGKSKDEVLDKLAKAITAQIEYTDEKVVAEFEAAKSKGITDGSRADEFVTRQQASIMALRAWKA
jgi:hypothetical protein